ncbi:hypothetical protein JAAARDRAFT_78212 [Jaapia argillacea MUCL 33604]|uniref:Uncharacterized protein n=1 Tax=Jaapia argillacea MUCL 33604 TaxID=933084 RepID=A0A067PUJ8_9AGAM|nr:hypothetical protein JAAARDRAFT_78212 [Jaapia argillacea MUCL 33604]
MSLLTVDNRIKLVTDAKCCVLSHLTRSDAKQTGADELDITLCDGFYRMIQKTSDGKPLDASLDAPKLLGQKQLPVVMDGDPQVTDRFWRLTRQFGVKHGYTIVPAWAPIADDSGLGPTTVDDKNAVFVRKDSCYPIWNVRCDESVTYRDADGKYITINLFRILEVGTNKCWKSDGGSGKQVKISQVAAGRPPADELFEMVMSVPEQNVSINSVQTITATASSGQIVRKFYFGAPVTASKIPLYVSVQLSTNARDQGWATHPDQGLWSWFELAILPKGFNTGDAVPVDKIKKAKDGSPLTFISHRLPLSSTYEDQTGMLFEKDHELFKNLADGDVIGVLACAQFAAWKCDARSGNMNFVELFVDPNA